MEEFSLVDTVPHYFRETSSLTRVGVNHVCEYCGLPLFQSEDNVERLSTSTSSSNVQKNSGSEHNGSERDSRGVSGAEDASEGFDSSDSESLRKEGDGEDGSSTDDVDVVDVQRSSGGVPVLRCDVCNYSCHVWCQRMVPIGCRKPQIIADESDGNVDSSAHRFALKHFGSHTYCNCCRQPLQKYNHPGYQCKICGYIVDPRCKRFAPTNCKKLFVTIPRHTLSFTHQFVEGNISRDCSVCGGHISRSNGLFGVRCVWCNIALHPRCIVDKEALEKAGLTFCQLGPLGPFILPPTSVLEVHDHVRVDPCMNATLTELEASTEDSCCKIRYGERNFIIRPLPGSTPVIVFLAEALGRKLIPVFQSLLNPFQVIPINPMFGPQSGVRLCSAIRGVTVLVVGSDATAGWVMKSFDDAPNTPPICVYPLEGSWNDFSRAMGWGTGFSLTESAEVFLHNVLKFGTQVRFDRWTVHMQVNATIPKTYDPVQYTTTPKPKGKASRIFGFGGWGVSSQGRKDGANAFSNVGYSSRPMYTFDVGESEETMIMNDYLSIGVDAKLLLQMREQSLENPKRFHFTPLRHMNVELNEFFSSRNVKLRELISLDCDGKEIELATSLLSLVICNVPSYCGGTVLWSGKKSGKWKGASVCDELLEVVGLTGASHLTQIKMRTRSAVRIAQCQTVTIRIMATEKVPIHLDGEAWMQPAGMITITPMRQVRVIQHVNRGCSSDKVDSRADAEKDEEAVPELVVEEEASSADKKSDEARDKKRSARTEDSDLDTSDDNSRTRARLEGNSLEKPEAEEDEERGRRKERTRAERRHTHTHGKKPSRSGEGEEEKKKSSRALDTGDETRKRSAHRNHRTQDVEEESRKKKGTNHGDSEEESKKKKSSHAETDEDHKKKRSSHDSEEESKKKKSSHAETDEDHKKKRSSHDSEEESKKKKSSHAETDEDHKKKRSSHDSEEEPQTRVR